jgi:hypothetical protein
MFNNSDTDEEIFQEGCEDGLSREEEMQQHDGSL